MAFQRIGWKWAGNVVGAGASLGLVASLIVAMLGQARYLCVLGRARLVPSWLAQVHPSRGTPLNATLFLGKQNLARVICFSMIFLISPGQYIPKKKKTQNKLIKIVSSN
jgi:amino acid transporter